MSAVCYVSVGVFIWIQKVIKNTSLLKEPCGVIMEVDIMYITVDPQLSGPRLSSTSIIQHLDYPAWGINDIHYVLGVR